MNDRSIDEFVDTGDAGSTASSGDDGEADRNTVQTDDDADGGGTSGPVADRRSALGSDAEGADDEHLKPQDGSEADSAAGATAAESQDGSAREPGDLEPPTAAWTPGGGVCASCGEAVERRWRGSAGLVCPDCKEW